MAEPIDEYFTATIAAMNSSTRRRAEDEPVRDGSSLTTRVCLALFDVQLGSRHLDLAARWLRAQGRGYYTIGSSGHEGNAAVAAALRPTDPALLHYRSVPSTWPGRARRRAASRCAMCCSGSSRRPTSRSRAAGTRCSAATTCTSFRRRRPSRRICRARSAWRSRSPAPRKLGVACAWPDDAVTVCSFGDASANHSTAVGAINAALHSAYQGVPMPLLFVCEDNGIGISVQTPARLDRADATETATACAYFARRRMRSGRDVRRRVPRPPTGCGPAGGRRSCICARCG